MGSPLMTKDLFYQYGRYKFWERYVASVKTFQLRTRLAFLQTIQCVCQKGK